MKEEEKKSKKNSIFPLKVDYSLAKKSEKQRKLQENCNHIETDVDISLADGNYRNRKSTIVSGYCTICGRSETIEL